MQTYANFLNSKAQLGGRSGFDPSWMPEQLFDFQRSLVEWSVQKGRAAIFADCGLGKTPMQLTWAENVVRKTNRPVLILTPLAVAGQTVREAEKFGIVCKRMGGGSPAGAGIFVTNYEKLQHFEAEDFAGVVCDESSCLKNYDAKRKEQITEFMRTRPYRLLCTATAAPNDYVELGTSSEAIGELGFQDMIGRFFKQETSKDHLGWGRTKYKLKGHAANGFWRWVCSWARACRKPSDLGFSDGNFVLPEMVTVEHAVKAKRAAPGMLFDIPARDLNAQREEQRRTLAERCEKAAALLNDGNPGVAWCHLNEESAMLKREIDGAEEVSGSDSDERKEEVFDAFAAGQFRVIVTKPRIGGFGLNWQHCAHMTFFPSHSFEQYYQSVRRCYRFGQKRQVVVDIVTTEGGAGIKANLIRKSEQAEEMFANLVSLMNDQLQIKRTAYGKERTEVPSWL